MVPARRRVQPVKQPCGCARETVRRRRARGREGGHVISVRCFSQRCLPFGRRALPFGLAHARRFWAATRAGGGHGPRRDTGWPQRLAALPPRGRRRSGAGWFALWRPRMRGQVRYPCTRRPAPARPRCRRPERLRRGGHGKARQGFCGEEGGVGISTRCPLWEAGIAGESTREVPNLSASRRSLGALRCSCARGRMSQGHTQMEDCISRQFLCT